MPDPGPVIVTSDEIVSSVPSNVIVPVSAGVMTISSVPLPVVEPVIVTSDEIASSDPADVIVPVSSGAKTISSAPLPTVEPSTEVSEFAASSASRNVTSPLTVELSARLVTVIVASNARSSSSSARSNEMRLATTTI